jgi:hypothetical protein
MYAKFGNVNIPIGELRDKAKKRKKEPIMRDYTAEAAEIVSRALTTDKDAMDKLGLDLGNKQSVIDFDWGYTLLGDSLLVKPLPTSGLYAVDGQKSSDKYIVLEVGMEIGKPIQKGDIISVGHPADPRPMSSSIKLKGIAVNEITSYSVGAIFISKDEYVERKHLRQLNDMLENSLIEEEYFKIVDEIKNPPVVLNTEAPAVNEGCL